MWGKVVGKEDRTAHYYLGNVSLCKGSILDHEDYVKYSADYPESNLCKTCNKELKQYKYIPA